MITDDMSSLGGLTPPVEVLEEILAKLHADDATSTEARISNQVEIDAMRLEARLAWEARRAKMTQEERDLEDLKRALSDLELYGYTGND